MGDIVVVDKGKRRKAVRRTTRLIATADQLCRFADTVSCVAVAIGRSTHATTSGRVPAKMMEPALSSGGSRDSARHLSRLKK